MTTADLAQIKEAARLGAIQGMAEYFSTIPTIASPLSRQQKTEALLIEAHQKLATREAKRAAKIAGGGV